MKHHHVVARPPHRVIFICGRRAAPTLGRPRKGNCNGSEKNNDSLELLFSFGDGVTSQYFYSQRSAKHHTDNLHSIPYTTNTTHRNMPPRSYQNGWKSADVHSNWAQGYRVREATAALFRSAFDLIRNPGNVFTAERVGRAKRTFGTVLP